MQNEPLLTAEGVTVICIVFRRYATSESEESSDNPVKSQRDDVEDRPHPDEKSDENAVFARPLEMAALVKSDRRPGLELDHVPLPEVGANDVLIRVHKTGICGTDLHIERWDAWAQATIPVPMVVGHEFVGEVVEFGANVTGL